MDVVFVLKLKIDSEKVLEERARVKWIRSFCAKDIVKNVEKEIRNVTCILE